MISLCIITGNEAVHISRFLESFAPVIDELCLVRAIGTQEPDGTEQTAREWAGKRGVPYRFAEYINATANAWPHVDDFAAARNAAFALATGDRMLWADLDDVLPAGEAEKIRALEAAPEDVMFFSYRLPGQHETFLRERFIRRGIPGAKWVNPIHENYAHHGATFALHPEVIFSHEPCENNSRDASRNARILTAHMEGRLQLFFHLGREHFLAWSRARFTSTPEQVAAHARLTQENFRVALAAPDKFNPVEVQEMLLYLSQIEHHEGNIQQAADYGWQSIRTLPDRRHAWANLAEVELSRGLTARALACARAMQGQPKPQPSGHPINTRYFGWHGAELSIRCSRAAGHEKTAREGEEEIFERAGRRITLVHATRGRAKQAIQTRKNWLDAASHPAAVEHIFCIDADDTESVQGLAHYRRHIVAEPNGCVKAWNEGVALTTGQIVIQLSDDWLPSVHWDAFVWGALERAAKLKGGTVADTPLVLQVSDGGRRDDLLCMAIATRARIAQQDGGTLFHPDYFGVYSDNEYSLRAFRDGVVVDAKNITFEHQHPAFGKAVTDATYERQNARVRYEEGEAIFKRRNPA